MKTPREELLTKSVLLVNSARGLMLTPWVIPPERKS